MNIDAAVAHACDQVPGMVRAALLLLPDGFLLGATRSASIFDLEPLIRSAARCFAAPVTPVIGGRHLPPFVEHVFVTADQLVVMQAGRRDPRIALGIVCTREHNVALVIGASRLVIAEIETSVDLSAWGL